MNKLSIEELKEMRASLQWLNSSISELREFAERQASAYDELIALREAQKGEQVPVADKCHPSMKESVTVPHNVIGTYEDASGGRSDIVTLSDKREMKGINYDVIAPGTAAMRGWGVSELLDPQKPVISKEKLCDWLEDNFDIDDSQRAAFAACFAHCCDCIVQSHSPAPVGEIVAWAGTDHEKGITREVDFRFLRFDVLPGTKLYALKPAPAILTDVLTAIRVGSSPTELVEALTAIKPKFGAPGSRDADVRAANLAIDKAIEKLSNL